MAFQTIALFWHYFQERDVYLPFFCWAMAILTNGQIPTGSLLDRFEGRSIAARNITLMMGYFLGAKEAIGRSS